MVLNVTLSWIGSNPLYMSQERAALCSRLFFFAGGIIFYLMVYKRQQGDKVNVNNLACAGLPLVYGLLT